ncbi:MAG: PKD domain-containing protein [Verrucomicrobiota bacterium]
MKSFIESPAHQLVKSRLTARASRHCPLDSETSDTWVHRRYWSVHPVICGWDGYLNYTETLVPNSGYGDIESVGSDYDVSRQWYAIQGGYMDVPRGPTSGINFRSRGKWKIDFTLRVFRAKVAHPESPDRNWLFFNLIRRAKDYLVDGDNSNLSALIRHVSGPVVIQDEPTLTRESEIIGGTPSEGVPAEAIPLTGANPTDVQCTWKIDVSGISATPESPYVFTDTLIVPETLEFCRVMFDVTPYEFGDSQQTIGTNVIEPYPPGVYYVSNTDNGSFGSSELVGYANSLSYLTLPEGAAQPALPDEVDLTIAFEFFDTYGVGGTPTVFMPMRNGQDVAYTGAPSDALVIHSAEEAAGYSGSALIWFNTNFVVGEQIVTAKPGQWDVPLIPALAGGAVDLAVTYVDGQPWTIAPDINAALAATPGWNGETQPDGNKGHSLWEIEVTLTRIAPMVCLWRAVKGAAKAFAFYDLSPSDPVSWLWDFGDGTTSTAQNPAHTYAAADTYHVTLTITNTIGETATHSGSIEVPLEASFSYAPGVYPKAQFTSTSVNAVSYLWNFGDGTTSTAQNPLHTFPSGAATYNVTLTVGDGSGHTHSVTQAVTLGPALAANFSAAAASSPAHTVQITDLSTGSPVSWAWLFVDGFNRFGNPITSTSTAQNPLHTYLSSGFHSTTLTIRDSQGYTASLQLSVNAP